MTHFPIVALVAKNGVTDCRLKYVESNDVLSEYLKMSFKSKVLECCLMLYLGILEMHLKTYLST